MRILLFSLGVLFLASCSTTEVRDSGPTGYVDMSRVKDAVPKDEPPSRMGNPSSYEVFGKRYYVLKNADNFTERGRASWYGNKFHGNATSNGEIYDMYKMTAAHKRLPLPTYVRVTNLDNNRQIVVRVNDRGPFHKGRIIDLSYVAAAKLGITKSGTAAVKVEALTQKQHRKYVETKKSTGSKESIAVQVGAFSLRSSAQQIRNKLSREFNVTVRVSEVFSAGKKLYRVRLGPFDNIRSATRWIDKLDSTSFGPASLVYLE